MNDRLLTLGGNRYSKTETMTRLIALAFVEGLGVVTLQGPESIIDLASIEKEFVVEPPTEQEPFFKKETAYERRNRGQKWYRKFNKRKHK